MILRSQMINKEARSEGEKLSLLHITSKEAARRQHDSSGRADVLGLRHSARHDMFQSWRAVLDTICPAKEVF
jgi:hypothetical protein